LFKNKTGGLQEKCAGADVSATTQDPDTKSMSDVQQ